MNAPTPLRSLRSRSKSYWRYLAQRILARQQVWSSLDDAAIRKTSLSLLYRAQSDEPLDQLLVDSFALVRESARRTVRMEHYPVQLIGGMTMHFGSVAIMQTGEGKTLTATLPMYLASLTGRGAHLATANDYLAERDAEIVRPIFEFLGRSVGVVVANSTREQRRQAYGCDLTYSTAKEIGFDFLRDRLLLREQGLQTGLGLSGTLAESDPVDQGAVQRDPYFVLIDEADSILIDEARTPLVVSASPDRVAQARTALYSWAAEVVTQFEEGTHFEAITANQIELNSAGRRFLRKLKHPETISEMPMLDIYEFVERAIFVRKNYVRERHYVIREGEVVIVDEFSGRLAEGRKWKGGLHQAIEAMEGVEISSETGDAAKITMQDLFLRYERVAGMTGTIAESAREMQKIYHLRSVQVPTNRPPKRTQWADQVYPTDQAKWLAIAREVREIHQSGRPILIGTRSIDKSQILSSLLEDDGIEHQVLNAIRVAEEAEVVARAGESGRVTVATNMAGRGTDIQLSDAALNAGGLHVIGSELHESARIDRQLIGRCGRQGDPGSYRQFLSLEDDILISGFGKAFARRLFENNQNVSRLNRFAPIFRRAQAKVERRHFQSRKMLLYHDRKRQELQREMGQDPYLDAPE